MSGVIPFRKGVDILGAETSLNIWDMSVCQVLYDDII